MTTKVRIDLQAGPVQEFRDQLQGAKRLSKIDEREFILTSWLIDWFRATSDSDKSHTNAARVLDAVYGDAKIPNERATLLEHINDDGPKCWLRTFAVLLQLKYNGENMGKYIHRFFELDFLDYRLGCPVKDNLEKQVFCHMDIPQSVAADLASKFEVLQWQLYTKTSLDGVYNKVYYGGKHNILPFTQKLALGKGGMSSIYMIEVPCECIPPALADKIKRNPHATSKGQVYTMTLKIVRHQKSYEREKDAYRALDRKEGILKSFGWWEFVREDNRKEYHVLLEWGSHDLMEFFRCWPPPTTTEAILRFWKDLLRIVAGLSKIHELVDGSNVTYYGWHCDIKPANILFCEGGHPNGWKIADPGFARFARVDKAQKPEGLPVIQLNGGTINYGAPEASHKEKPMVSQRFDIWSLGCVLLEAATWVVLGHRGVQQFYHLRRLNRPGKDQFHDGLKVSTTVRDWYSHIRHSLRKSDTVTSKILTIIEDNMLQGNPHNRLEASALSKIFKSVTDAAGKTLASEEPSNNRYEIPAYFQEAIVLEQEDEAEELKRRLGDAGSEEWREKYNTQSFFNATKRPLEHHDEDSDETNSFIQSVSPSDKSTYGIKRAATGPAGGMIPHERPKGPDLMYADYHEIRTKLEAAGWKSGTLELPEQDQQGYPSNPNDNSSPIRSANTRISWKGPTLPLTSPPTRDTLHRAKRRSMFFQSVLGRFAGSAASGEASSRPQVSPIQPHSASSNEGPAQKIRTDEAKHAELDSYFEDRDIAFLVDNGWSMRHHWIWARDLLAVLTAFLNGQDDDGMDLYFTSWREKVGTFTMPKQFVDEMDLHKPKPPSAGQPTSEPARIHQIIPGFTVIPRASTVSTTSSTDSNHLNPENIRFILQRILDDWLTKFNNRRNNTKSKKKLTLIILTDGIWSAVQDKGTVADEIVNSLDRSLGAGSSSSLEDALNERSLSIQFVRFGNDERAIIELDRMDNSLVHWRTNVKLPDIIDHEPANGNIYKMILGSLDPRYDEHDETQTSESQSYASSNASTPIASNPRNNRSQTMPRNVGATDAPIDMNHF